MVEVKRAKKKRPAKRELTERRFLPEQTHASMVSVVLGMIGALVLGIGVYGQWLREDPMKFASPLVALGAIALGASLWLSTVGLFPVRVGDAGIAMERGSQISRLRWCDIEKLILQRAQLVVHSSNAVLTIPVGAHPKATSLILAEAERRIPSRVDAPSDQRARLAPVTDRDGERVPVEDFQVAGHRCAASDTLISFERDARLCPNCGQVYHHQHVPKKCVTCDTDMSGRAVAV